MLILVKSNFNQNKKKSILIWCYHYVELKHKSLQTEALHDYGVVTAIQAQHSSHPPPMEAAAKLIDNCLPSYQSTHTLRDVTCERINMQLDWFND